MQSNVGGVDYVYPAINTGTTSTLNHGTNVVPTATTSAQSTSAWTICTGTAVGNGTTEATCTYVSLDGHKTAEATFTLNSYNLTVTPSGMGSGTVTGNGIACAWNGSSSSGTCSVNLDYNTAVSMLPHPSTGSTFMGWSGQRLGLELQRGTGNCDFNLTEVSGVGAPFTLRCLLYLPLIIRP